MRSPIHVPPPVWRRPPLESVGFCALLVAGACGEQAWWKSTPWGLLAVAVLILVAQPRNPFVHPVLLFAVGFVFLIVTGGTHISWPGRIAVAIAVFLFARRLTARRTTVLTAAALCLQAVWYFGYAPAGESDTALVNFTLALAVTQITLAVVGHLVLQHRVLHEAVLARAEATNRAQRLQAETAARDEQDRVSSEMHDVIGHRVGNIVMLARALEQDPGRSREDVVRDAALIGREGRAALEELREIFHGMASRLPAEPLRGLEDLEVLVADTGRALGQEISLEVDGFPEVLALPVQHAVRRTVQEGLANAAKHAPGAAIGITLVCARDGVHLTLVSGPPAGGAPSRPRLPAGGSGLAGVRARVAVLGGTLDARPQPDGGFRLAIHIPRRGAPAAGP
ncbi:sensor histidine kinase [Streptomyces goshikiensis]|uniref:sensor histidine kinase n=1 Tax=Streptomyces goshikiensis TaxID=1942 RepID=UPI00367E20F4